MFETYFCGWQAFWSGMIFFTHLNQKAMRAIESNKLLMDQEAVMVMVIVNAMS